jgi:hypothetical protein
VQIERGREYQKKLNDVAEQTGISSLFLVEQIFFPKGYLDAQKLTGFLESKGELIEEYDGDSEELLTHLCPKCIRPSGKIHQAKLRRNKRKSTNNI